MKIIISCCDRKNGEAFQHNGNIINFISHKNQLPNGSGLYFHPDDFIPNENTTWRELIAQQEIRKDLLPTYELYRPKIYNSLYQTFGEDLFIFSAGWGIVNAGYKLPKYNITFSRGNNIPFYAVRNYEAGFNDFNQLENIDVNDKIILIAGKDYVFPFCQLTNHLPNAKIIIYKNAEILKNNPYLNHNNFKFFHYVTNRRTNWHYEFADRLINNQIEF
jgi:hypothetical protein